MATLSSVKAGNWSDPTVWNSGSVPASGDTINITHAIIMDLNETDGTKLYGRININTNGSLIHASGTPTCFCCGMYVYVNGGRYEMTPNSTVKFKGTSKTGGSEGQVVGIYAVGSTNGTQLVLNGSVPTPETYLTQATDVDAYQFKVASTSGFTAGEYVSIYYDSSGDSTWGWSGVNQNDEGFIVHKVVDSTTILLKLRVGIESTITTTMTIGSNYAIIADANKYQYGNTVFIDDEFFKISSIDLSTNRVNFTSVSTVLHNSGAKVVECGAQKSHSVGDKLYKIATIISSDYSAGTNVISVANSVKLDVGDRIVIEGYTRTYNKEFETTILSKTGNTLTLASNLPYLIKTGFIVTKTNRDCVVTTTDLTDSNRVMVYYVYGSSSILNRKCVLRYCEVSHVGNSYSGNYCGVCVRGDFNRTDTEREMRGCVVRDGWSLDRCGVWAYSAHYMHFRNNVICKTYNGLNPYDVNGSSFYNNISIGSISSTYRYESTYYYNQFQYNIGLNSAYAMLYYSDYNSIYPEWHNIFKHVERGLYFSQACIGAQYGSFMKNKYEDVYFKHALSEGTRVVAQDIEVIPSSDATNSNWGSSYGNYDERGLNGGMLVIVNKDFIRGNFEMHSYGGRILKDEIEHMGCGWSYQYNSNITSVDLRISEMVYCRGGIKTTVTAWVKKNSAYNGSVRPRIVARGIYFNEIQNGDYIKTGTEQNTLIYKEMENVNDMWVKIVLEFIPPKSELIQIGIGGRGTAGQCWFDPRVNVSTFDSILINGPYSVNLMFGLKQITDYEPSVVLGGVNL